MKVKTVVKKKKIYGIFIKSWNDIYILVEFVHILYTRVTLKVIILFYYVGPWYLDRCWYYGSSDWTFLQIHNFFFFITELSGEIAWYESVHETELYHLIPPYETKQQKKLLINICWHLLNVWRPNNGYEYSQVVGNVCDRSFFRQFCTSVNP